jgi:U3 small nucleolar RNA-associated protein 18
MKDWKALMMLTWVLGSNYFRYSTDRIVQLFFLDSGPPGTGEGALIISKAPGDGVIQTTVNAPVWEDSDDERMMVCLASNPRLRKLRLTESEDMVNGKEYTERLRRQ